MGKHEIDVVDAQGDALGAFDQIYDGSEAVTNVLYLSVLVEDEVHEYFGHFGCVGSQDASC